MKFQPDEKVLGVFRRHWLTFVLALAPIIILAAIAIASPILFGIFLPELVGDNSLIVLGAILVLEVLWIVGFLIVTDYYLDVWIVTNRRLIFIELHGLFSRVTSSVTLMHIQDVTVKVHGILGTFLKYGEVKVQSAGTEGEFTFKQVPKPYQVKDLILTTRESFLQRGKAKPMDIHKADGTTHN